MGYELLKALEVPEEGIPINNQPIEDIVEESVGGKTRFKTPPFLMTFEILNHKVQKILVDSVKFSYAYLRHQYFISYS